MTTILDSEAALTSALAALTAHDPVMERVLAISGRPPLRKRDPGFHGLAGIIVSQQLSTASAGAIWSRVTARFDPLDHHAVLAATDEDLRAVGLSLPKMRALRAAAQAVAAGTLDLESLVALEAEAAHRALTAVKGIGPWTADIYLLFCLGHPDIFPDGDLALQEAARLVLALDARPSDKTLRALAERWRPWRGVAAYVLWAYYRVAKSREGAPLPAA